MAPELARDPARVDARADIYSLGCTLYYLLTGRPPFEGRSAIEILNKQEAEPVTPPEQLVERDTQVAVGDQPQNDGEKARGTLWKPRSGD